MSAVSKSSSLSVSVAASAAEKVDAVLCGPEDEVVAQAELSAHSIASAFAEAIAEVTAECYASTSFFPQLLASSHCDTMLCALSSGVRQTWPKACNVAICANVATTLGSKHLTLSNCVS